jgi:hypothetical protein
MAMVEAVWSAALDLEIQRCPNEFIDPEDTSAVGET